MTLLTLTSLSAETVWTDVTSLFVKSPRFDNDKQTGWAWESNATTQAVRVECISFYNGYFDLHQQLTGLPKGRYRLRVQGFYRMADQQPSYNAHQDGSETITAQLYAGTATKKLVSMYSSALSYDPGRSWTPDNKHYYPDGKEAALAAFSEDMYWNVLEFEAEGDLMIGVACSEYQGNNYCVLDNFRLEYDGTISPAGAVAINEIMAANIDEYISPAFNFDGWIELYNAASHPVSISGLLLSDPVNGKGPWRLPEGIGILPAKGFGLIWFDSGDISPINAPFKLNTDGGCIVISSDDGTELARQDYPPAIGRTSYARLSDGSGKWGYTATPTPGATNGGTVSASRQLYAPEVNEPSQLFEGTLSVRVTIPAGTTLHYTTDGTLPTVTSPKSTDGKFSVSQTMSFRFRLFADNVLPSEVTTRSYIKRDKDYYLPVVSVVTDPDFLYSTEIGVMKKGPNGRPGNGQSDNCNWNMDWERPVNFSYLNGDGMMVFNQDVNLEMCGGWSRAWEPHAFKLKGNKELGGNKNLDYPFFVQKPYIHNRTLQIRNGGNDNNCRFRDPALQYILQSAGVNIDSQSYQPVHEFINGNYIGVLNMREPNNKHYVYANYGWDDDEIDQFEMSPDSGYVQKCGTSEAFDELVTLTADAANAETYQEICRLMDVDAYANYMAVELYLNNWDWPQNNVKGFRHRDGGQFRFVCFDIDGSFNSNDPFSQFFGKEIYTFDQLRPSSLGRLYNEPIYFVTLFKNMLKNAQFRRKFIDAYCIMGGSVYEKNRAAAIINMLLERVESAMALEIRNSKPNSASSTANSVKSNLNGRLSRAINAIKNYSTFGLGQVAAQQVEILSDTQGAQLFINGQKIPTGTFNGQLFSPVTISAKAPAGYLFKGWYDKQDNQITTAEEIAMPSGAVYLKACFNRLSESQLTEQGITPVCINEVSGANDSYIDEYGKKGDWLELYNTTDQEIDVEGMYLTDDPNETTKYQITRGTTQAQTVIPAHGYLIIWCDNKRATTDRGLHATFKISDDGGQLMLMAADKSWTNTISYPAHDARTTIVRYPDGAPTVYTSNVPTIAQPNQHTSYMVQIDQDKPYHDGVNTITATAFRLRYGSEQLLVKGLEGDGSVSITVYTADGKLVGQGDVSLSNGAARMSVASLPRGFYVARATAADGRSAICRFVKTQ